MIIDSHHHLWHYTDDEFGWIADDCLRRDFTPEDLKETIRNAAVSEGVAQPCVEKVVSVEARQCVGETDCLLDFSAKHDFIAGVVGWLPIAEPSFPALLERYAENPKLVALRHVVQDEPDDAFILRDDFNRGISRLRGTGLVYDILVFQRQLANAIRFVDRHAEDQMFVLDHIGKPRPDAFGEWKRLVLDLARRPNVFCKFSGVVTEVGTEYDRVRACFDTILEAFGPDRLMWGSDWPVVTAHLAYGEWLRRSMELAAVLSADERGQFFGGTAERVYLNDKLNIRG